MTSRKPRTSAPPPPPRPLAFHAAAPRRFDGGMTTHADFPGVVLSPDDHGVIYPQSPDEVRLADALGLPVIHDEE